MAPKSTGAVWTYWLLGVVSLGGMALVSSFADADLWGRLAMGALLLQNGRFPYHDPFSYTAAGALWVDHEWGSGLLMYSIFKAWGSAGLQYLLLGLLALNLGALWRCFLVPYKHAPERLQAVLPSLAIFFIGFIFLMTSYYMTLRCQLFSYAAYSLILYGLQQYRYQPMIRRLWWLPPLMLLWANLHAGFIMGFFAMGAFILALAWDRQWKHTRALAGLGLLGFLLTLINPYGWDFYRYLFFAWTLPREGIAEWGGLWAASYLIAILYTGLFLTVLTMAGVHWQRQKAKGFPWAWLMLLATGIEGWLHLKLAPFFYLTAFGLGAEWLPEISWLAASGRFSQRLRRVIMCLPVSLLVLTGYFVTRHPDMSLQVMTAELATDSQSTHRVIYPVGASDYMQRHRIQGNLWTPFGWGEFLIWNLYPGIKVSMDGRYETVYSQEAFLDNYRFFMAPFPVEILKKYPATQHVLIPTQTRALHQTLAQDTTWHLCYQDQTASLFSKTAACPLEIQAAPPQTLNLDRFPVVPGRFVLESF